MIRTLPAVCLALVLVAMPLRAQAPAPPDVGGQWRVTFVTPAQGEVAVTMTINQTGSKLTGHVIDEYGEYDLQGRIADAEVTATWTVPEDGKMLDITMKGKLEGNAITGTAKLGNVGEGPLSARRIGDAGDR